MRKAYRTINAFNWTEEELEAYHKEQKAMLDAENARETFFEMGEEVGEARGLIKGKAEGLAEGARKEKAALIVRFWKKGYPLEEIAELTELTIEEVQDFIPKKPRTDM
jgi:predicted transposase/invertase (TIGR01784 family)